MNTSVSPRPSPLWTFRLSRERPQRRVASKDKRGETVLYVGYTPRDHDDLPTQAILKSVTLVIMHGVTCQASIGSLRCGRFRGDGDVTAQVDWARGCRSRAKINLLKILMTASVTWSSTSAVLSAIQSLLFLTWPHLKIFDNFSFFTTMLILSAMKISCCFTSPCIDLSNICWMKLFCLNTNGTYPHKLLL